MLQNTIYIISLYSKCEISNKINGCIGGIFGDSFSLFIFSLQFSLLLRCLLAELGIFVGHLTAWQVEMFAQYFPHFIGVNSGVLHLVLCGLNDWQELDVQPGVRGGEGGQQESPRAVPLYPGPGDRVHRVGAPHTHRLDGLPGGESAGSEQDESLAVSVGALGEDEELRPTWSRNMLVGVEV